MAAVPARHLTEGSNSRQHPSGLKRKSAGMIRVRAAAERNTSIVTDRALVTLPEPETTPQDRFESSSITFAIRN